MFDRMFNIIRRLFDTSITVGEVVLDESEELYQKAAPLVLAAFGIGLVYIIVLLSINAAGGQGWNVIGLFIVIMLGIFIYFSPRIFFTAIGLEVVATALRGENITSGAKNGATILYRLILNIVFYVGLVAWWLMIWPYEHAPLAFFPAMGMLLMVQLACLKLEISGNVLTWIVLIVSIISFGMIQWSTLTPKADIIAEQWRNEAALEAQRERAKYNERHAIIYKDGLRILNHDSIVSDLRPRVERRDYLFTGGSVTFKIPKRGWCVEWADASLKLKWESEDKFTVILETLKPYPESTLTFVKTIRC